MDVPVDVATWAKCTAATDCAGAQVSPYGRCLAHLHPDELRDELARISAGEAHIDARGTEITTTLMRQLRDAAPRDDVGRSIVAGADFTGARFRGYAAFSDVLFDGPARFMYATFEADASFQRAWFRTPGAPAGLFDCAVFRAAALFGEPLNIVNVEPSSDSAHFDGAARFIGTAFQGPAYFREVSFGFATLFDDAAFHDRAEFASAFFDGSASFADATFHSDTSFRQSRFGGSASFGLDIGEAGGRFGAVFHGDAAFHQATFDDYVHFAHAEFRAKAYFNSATFASGVGFDHALFAGDTTFDRSTVRGLADFPFTAFEGRARLTGLEWEAAMFEDARFARSAMLTGARDGRSPVRVLSLRRAEVGFLLLDDVDLRSCRLDGARTLDQLALGARVSFAAPPLRGRWGRRRVLAEECVWRAAARPSWRDQGWCPPEVQLPEGISEEEAPLQPGVVAQLYRELRKGREDRRNEPAAADFYYGEMEMRRHNPAATRSERAVITAYWASCGYGLRSSRAFTWLGVVLVLSAVLFTLFGFEDDQSWLRAFFVSVTATAFRQIEDIELTFGGEVLSAILRIIGPLLLALALISVRGRVKR